MAKSKYPKRRYTKQEQHEDAMVTGIKLALTNLRQAIKAANDSGLETSFQDPGSIKVWRMISR